MSKELTFDESKNIIDSLRNYTDNLYYHGEIVKSLRIGVPKLFVIANRESYVTAEILKVFLLNWDNLYDICEVLAEMTYQPGANSA